MSDKHVMGMSLFVASEFVFFTVLILAFVFYRQSPANIGGPTVFNSLDVPTTGFYTACLTASSVTFWLAERSHRRNRTGQWHALLLLTILLGGAFIWGEAQDFAKMSGQGIVPSTNLFGTTFYALVGFHGFHVAMGLIVLLSVFGISLRSRFFRGAAHARAIRTIAIYWIFVDAMWWIIFPTVYLWSLGNHGILGEPFKAVPFR